MSERINKKAFPTILIHNYKNKDEQKPLLTEEIELLTAPYELALYKNAIMEAVRKGTARFVQSEDDGKNTAAG